MKITKRQIFRYFKGETTEQEEKDLDKWIGESEEHARAFTDARIEFEYIVMHADISVLKEALQAHPSRRNTVDAEAVKKLDLGWGNGLVDFLYFLFSYPTSYFL